jgi:uncharacterized protein
MRYFLYKLIPPRPTFPEDMTDAEGELMQEHFNYWKNLVDRRIAIVYGPVSDPKGVYGIAIIETEDGTSVHDIRINDPAIKHNVGFKSEIHLMPEVILRR